MPDYGAADQSSASWYHYHRLLLVIASGRPLAKGGLIYVAIFLNMMAHDDFGNKDSDSFGNQSLIER